jgi:hypothetical protein
MNEHEFELREVRRESPDADGERLRESVVGDVAASIGALASTGAFGYAAASFHNGRQHDTDDAYHEAEMAALRAQMDAEMRVLRAEMDAEMRVLREQGFGVDDDYFDGFEVE